MTKISCVKKYFLRKPLFEGARKPVVRVRIRPHSNSGAQINLLWLRQRAREGRDHGREFFARSVPEGTSCIRLTEISSLKAASARDCSVCVICCLLAPWLDLASLRWAGRGWLGGSLWAPRREQRRLQSAVCSNPPATGPTRLYFMQACSARGLWSGIGANRDRGVAAG